ncbi:MAG: 2-dehydropantoate 2-reductase [Anaerolineales bacterium]
MRIIIYGTGAVGGYIGVSLALGHHTIDFIGRPRVVAAVRQEGFVLRTDDGDRHLMTDAVFPSMESALAAGSPDLILLTVKAYDCEGAANDIAASSTTAPVVSLINGIGSETILTNHLGPDRVLAGTVTTAVEMPSPNRILVRRARGVGLAEGHPAAAELAQALIESGVPVRQYDRPAAMKWSKLLTNLTANASAAITGLPADQIYRDSRLFRLEIRALREAINVIHHLGLPIVNLPGVPVRPLTWAVRMPPFISQPLLRPAIAGGRGGKMPSMFYDVGRGRTEVEWLNGAVVSTAQRLGLPAPANFTLTEKVRQLADEPASIEQHRLSPSDLIALARTNGVTGL